MSTQHRQGLAKRNEASTTLPVELTQAQVQSVEKTPIAIGLPIFVLVILALIYGGYWAYGYLQDEQKLPVQEVVVSGDLSVIEPSDIEAIVREQSKGSFFALDVNEIHALMEGQDWVFSASVRKRWPSRLYIHIVEQKAVAVWNGDLMLNRYGEAFDGMGLARQKPDGQDLLSKLPALFGPGGSEKTALTGYIHMQGLLGASGQQIEQLSLSERFAWQAKLSNEIVLRLGRQEYINRLQRFIDVYPILQQENKLIDYVDLRYDTGMAVGWENPESNDENTQNNT